MPTSADCGWDLCLPPPPLEFADAPTMAWIDDLPSPVKEDIGPKSLAAVLSFEFGTATARSGRAQPSFPRPRVASSPHPLIPSSPRPLISSSPHLLIPSERSECPVIPSERSESGICTPPQRWRPALPVCSPRTRLAIGERDRHHCAPSPRRGMLSGGSRARCRIRAALDARGERARSTPGVPLEAVIITSELSRRTSRDRDLAAEHLAVTAADGGHGERRRRKPPATAFSSVSSIRRCSLCKADSAGMSMLEMDGDRRGVSLARDRRPVGAPHRRNDRSRPQRVRPRGADERARADGAAPAALRNVAGATSPSPRC